MRTSDVLARYGGEEFVILLTNTDQSTALDIAERIRKMVAEHSFVINPVTTLQVTLSVGLAVMDPKHNIKSSRALIDSADQAVYAAKVSGRNRVHYTHP